MKTFKFLMATFIVVFLVSMNTYAQSKSVIWQTDMCFFCPCANDAQGEMLCGTLIFHVVENNSIVRWNIIGGTLTGETTGKTYHFSRTSTFDPETGKLVLNVRTKGEGGLVTFWQIVGEGVYDEAFDEYFPVMEEDQKFFCR